MPYNRIRNRRLVALENVKLACGYHRNPDAPFADKIASRALYDKGLYLTLQSEKKGNPRAKFERIEISKGAFMWAPQNDAARQYLKELTTDEQIEFLNHAPPAPKPRQCESRRVVDGSPIKALPNGKREADVFPNEHTPRKSTIRSSDEFSRQSTPVVILESEMDRIRATITAAS